MFSLPSRETQFPRSCSCTFRVGLDVIGTSNWHALKARMHRQMAMPKPRLRRVKFDEVTARGRNELNPFSDYLGSFDAITSIFSIEGDFAKSSDAFSLKARATSPFKCASRPESSANVSKIPYVDGAILMANHDTVFGSASTNA